MQTPEQYLVPPAAATEELDNHLTPEEADLIFQLAEAEIQPILRKMRRERLTGWLQGILCVAMILFSMGGIVWQCITYPHTRVVLFTKARAASVTATLDLPTRTLAPVTLTRSVTAPTTGIGHQDARAASGTLTFYIGNASQQTIAIGTVLTGSDGVQVRTDQAVTIPAANPPYSGQATTTTTLSQTGSRENIHAFDFNGAVSGSVFVKNLAAFTGGRDARTFRAVAPKDLTALTPTLNARLTQAFTTAFSLQPGAARSYLSRSWKHSDELEKRYSVYRCSQWEMGIYIFTRLRATSRAANTRRQSSESKSLSSQDRRYLLRRCTTYLTISRSY